MRDKGEICKSTIQGLDTFFVKSRAEKIGGETHSCWAPRVLYCLRLHMIHLYEVRWQQWVSRKDRQRGKEDRPLVSLQVLPLCSDNQEQNTPLFPKQVKNEISAETSTFFHMDSSCFCSTFSLNVSCSYGMWITPSVTELVSLTHTFRQWHLFTNVLSDSA